MKTSWLETRTGVIDIRIRAGILPRLFGLPFLAIACYFGYRVVAQCARALGSIGRGGRPDLLELSITLVLMLALTAVFAVAGTFLTFAVFRTRIDVASRRVTSSQGVPGFARRETADVTPGSVLAIVYLPGRIDSAEKMDRNGVSGFAVILERAGQLPMTLAWFSESCGDQARALAMLLCERLGLPRADRTPRRDVRSSGPTPIAIPAPSPRSETHSTVGSGR